MIIITDPELIDHEAALINALFEEGLEVLHLRKPEATVLQMSELLSQIQRRFQSRVMVHSHYELLDSFNLKGIHFTEKEKHLLDDFKQVKCTKSLPVHDLVELEGVDPSFDYVFLSPLFPSISKNGYSKEWNLEELKNILAKKRTFKVVALGGITLDNVKQVKELGFDDYALLGSIWEPAKIGASLNEIVKIYKAFECD